MKIFKNGTWRKNGGCNEDCFNCPYPDCLKPTHEIRTDNSYSIPIAKGTAESQPKRCTIELKGFKL